MVRQTGEGTQETSPTQFFFKCQQDVHSTEFQQAAPEHDQMSLDQRLCRSWLSERSALSVCGPDGSQREVWGYISTGVASAEAAASSSSSSVGTPREPSNRNSHLIPSNDLSLLSPPPPAVNQLWWMMHSQQI